MLLTEYNVGPRGAPIREIVVAIYGRHEHSLHDGVKSYLDRLMEKGYVAVDKSGFAHWFTPMFVVPRDRAGN